MKSAAGKKRCPKKIDQRQEKVVQQATDKKDKNK
jgi:hypothetical protein